MVVYQPANRRCTILALIVLTAVTLITLDVRGSGAEALEPELISAVLVRWPRRDFPAEFEAVLADEVRAHPDSVRMSWLESVASAHVPGFVPTDFLAGLRATEGFA